MSLETKTVKEQILEELRKRTIKLFLRVFDTQQFDLEKVKEVISDLNELAEALK